MKMERILGGGEITWHKGGRGILSAWTVGVLAGSAPQFSVFPHLSYKMETRRACSIAQ